MIHTVAALLGYSSLAACGNDPKAPSEANFMPIIKAEIARKNPYCEVVLKGHYMYAIGASPLQSALAKRGLLMPYARYPGSWVVSPEGMKLGPAGNRNNGDFIACIAEGADVASIINWTEPASMFGSIVTTVTYTVRPTKVAAWITPDLEPLIPQLKDGHQRTIGLQLTAKGWENARL